MSYFPPGSTVNKEFKLPNGGTLVLQDNKGKVIESWKLIPVVDDWGKVIPEAKYKIAAGPVALPKPQDTQR